MPVINDTIVVGIVLFLVVGALVYYLYTRILFVETRLKLSEGILVDLRTMGAFGIESGGQAQQEHYDLSQYQVASDENEDDYKDILMQSHVAANATDHVEDSNESDLTSITADDYADVMKAAHQDANSNSNSLQEVDDSDDSINSTAVLTDLPIPRTELTPSYEAMTMNELRTEATRRGITGISSYKRKKDLIDVLNGSSSISGSKLGPEGPMGDFPGPTQ